MIRRAITHTLSSQIIDAGKDTKKLFSLINTMTGSRKSNPLPPSTSDEELAGEFATFFKNKIKKSEMHLILILNLSLLNRTPASPLITLMCLLKMKLKNHYVHALQILLNWMYCQPKCSRRSSNPCFPCLQKLSIYHYLKGCL